MQSYLSPHEDEGVIANINSLSDTTPEHVLSNT